MTVRKVLSTAWDFIKGPEPYQCPDCGHWWGISGPDGPPHDETACEVAKLHRKVDALQKAILADLDADHPFDHEHVYDPHCYCDSCNVKFHFDQGRVWSLKRIMHDLMDPQDCDCPDCRRYNAIRERYRLAIIDAATDPTEQMIT